nr:hypothetical protein CFP56_11554 [Quercus suber]
MSPGFDFGIRRNLGEIEKPSLQSSREWFFVYERRARFIVCPIASGLHRNILHNRQGRNKALQCNARRELAVVSGCFTGRSRTVIKSSAACNRNFLRCRHLENAIVDVGGSAVVVDIIPTWMEMGELQPCVRSGGIATGQGIVSRADWPRGWTDAEMI